MNRSAPSRKGECVGRGSRVQVAQGVCRLTSYAGQEQGSQQAPHNVCTTSAPPYDIIRSGLEGLEWGKMLLKGSRNLQKLTVEERLRASSRGRSQRIIALHYLKFNCSKANMRMVRHDIHDM